MSALLDDMARLIAAKRTQPAYSQGFADAAQRLAAAAKIQPPVLTWSTTGQVKR